MPTKGFRGIYAVVMEKEGESSALYIGSEIDASRAGQLFIIPVAQYCPGSSPATFNKRLQRVTRGLLCWTKMHVYGRLWCPRRELSSCCLKKHVQWFHAVTPMMTDSYYHHCVNWNPSCSDLSSKEKVCGEIASSFEELVLAKMLRNPPK